GRSPVGVVITGGAKARLNENGLWRVSKSVLVRAVATALETGSLRIAAGLPHAHILVAELRAFKASIGENGRAKFEAAAGVHDALVLAVALALWRLQSRAKKAAA